MSSMSDFKQFFKECDTDNSGYLTEDEVFRLLRARGYKGTDCDLKAFFRGCDTSGDGKITMEEFLQAMGCIPPQNHREAAMRGVFQGFDKDGSGSIDAGEMQAVFKEMGKHLSQEEVERMIYLVDKDGSGTLEYEEFIAHCFGQ